MIEVRLPRSFAVVAELGSFTEAARHLHVSQPALSQQIKTLERRLRAPLFVRSGGPTRPTPAGEQLLRHASTTPPTRCSAWPRPAPDGCGSGW